MLLIGKWIGTSKSSEAKRNGFIPKTISPIDGKEYVCRELATESHVRSVLALSQSTQRVWAQTSLEERKRICVKALDWLQSNQEKLGLELCWQIGRPIRYAKNEIAGVVERGEFMIAASEKVLSTISVAEKTGYTRYMEREPIGVVFVVAPWNYPYLTAINSIIPALLAGNSVVLKHSAQTPLCAERLVEAFEHAGLPKGIFQYLHLNHSMAESVVRSGEVNHVAFTGSVKAGRAMEQFAAGQFIGLGLELGGKDPATYVKMQIWILRPRQLLKAHFLIQVSRVAQLNESMFITLFTSRL